MNGMTKEAYLTKKPSLQATENTEMKGIPVLLEAHLMGGEDLNGNQWFSLCVLCGKLIFQVYGVAVLGNGPNSIGTQL
jgi:hypothetical protein